MTYLYVLILIFLRTRIIALFYDLKLERIERSVGYQKKSNSWMKVGLARDLLLDRMLS